MRLHKSRNQQRSFELFLFLLSQFSFTVFHKEFVSLELFELDQEISDVILELYLILVEFVQSADKLLYLYPTS